MLRISRKVDYALFLLTELARDSHFISLSEISKMRGLSLRFLEQIAKDLKRAEIIRSKEGKNGGYKLNKKADDINLLQIVRLFEGNLALAKCLKEGCIYQNCSFKRTWEKLGFAIENTLSKETLASFIGK